MDTVGPDRLRTWVRANRGAVVLCRSAPGSPLWSRPARTFLLRTNSASCVCSLLNSCDASAAAEVKAALEPIRSQISSLGTKGAQVLLENLAQ